MKKFLLLTLILLFAFTTYFAQSDDVLRVDASQTLHKISPYALGASYGAYSSLPPDQFESAEQSGVGFIRFPGGSAFDKDGRDVPNFLVDLLITVCNLIGAEPSIQVRLYGSTPEKAVELLTYVNIEKEYNVRYWYIGNEPNLYAEDYTVEEFNLAWRKVAEAMLEVDPDIILIGPELSQYPGSAETNPKDVNGKDWMDEFLTANGDLVDIVSVHRYPFPQGRNNITTIDDLRQNSQEWDTIIPFLRERVQTITGEDKPLAVTEINSHYINTSRGEATPDSYYHAIWFADVLGRMMKQNLEIIIYFELYSGSDRAFGLIERYSVRPTYYTYQLYQKFGSTLVESSSEDPNVTVYAALHEDGSLCVMVINLGDEEATKTLEIEGFTAGEAVEVWRLDAEHNAELVEGETLNESVVLPGQSITLYIIPAA